MARPTLSHILGPSRVPSEPVYLPSPPAAQHATAAASYGVHAAVIDSASQDPRPLPKPPQADTKAPPATAAKISQPGRDGKNLYACSDCGRSYSRPEHLVRHVQTHTLGRRFTCEICQKSFARKDLLRRHVANHDNDSPTKRRRLTSSPAAGRVSQACRACAAARVKCDDDKPCRRCVNRKLSCVAEAGSSAALHLGQLSAYPHAGPPGTQSQASPSSSSPDSHGRTPSMLTESQIGWRATTTTDSSSHTASFGRLESQVTTPDTSGEQGLDHNIPEFEPPSGVVDVNTSAFHEFLRDILYEQPLAPAKLADSQGPAVLDFCDNANLDLTDVDFSLLGNWNLDNLAETGSLMQDAIPGTEQPVDISQMRQNLVRAWTKSPWRWDPKTHDSGYREQGNLPLPSLAATNAQLQASGYRLERVVEDKMEQSGRDQVLAIVLGTCRQSALLDRVAASFPTVDLMDMLVHVFLASQACQVSQWIHFPTFQLNNQWPEWMAVAAAAGAVLIPVPTLRKFGLALQEAVRVSIPERFEKKNTAIQDSGLVQSLVLVQDIALWSGNRRKMEIAECHLQIPVTMMRYRRKFQRSSYDLIAVNEADTGAVLEEKWQRWCEREHWKRLVFHCYLRDSQTSMTTLTHTSMSYSELTLPLPEAKELWFAKTADEWKRGWLGFNAHQGKRPPSIGDLFHDVRLLAVNQQRLDVQFSISIFLHGFWTMILEYRQLSAVHRWRSYTSNTGSTTALLLRSRHDELVKQLQDFRSLVAGLADMTAQEHVVMNLLSMNLHVSHDDLQLFAGKEGETQARRVYPLLQQWAASSEARSAVWHAGQVLRYAKSFPAGHLKDFYAVAVHHASLTLWTYGVVVRATRQQLQAVQYGHEVVYLDGIDAASMERFTGYGQGRPVIRGPIRGDSAVEAPLQDPRACMDVAEDILRTSSAQGADSVPPIVENLCHVIKQLGQAAWAVGLG